MARLKGTTFNELDRILGSANTRVIGNETVAQREGDTITVSLFENEIVVLFPMGGVLVRDAGWRTVTTKERVNQFLPAGVRVSQMNREWFVSGVPSEHHEWKGNLLVEANGQVRSWT